MSRDRRLHPDIGLARPADGDVVPATAYHATGAGSLRLLWLPSIGQPTTGRLPGGWATAPLAAHGTAGYR